MCGRYVLAIVGEEFATRCELQTSPADFRRYNIAPSQEAPIIGENAEGNNELRYGKWGFVIGKGKETSRLLINARVETVLEKPTFRSSVLNRRCIVPASGFYEWKDKKPHFIKPSEQELFFFAGIWRPQEQNAGKDQEFAIITTEATAGVRSLHDRMPLVVPDTLKADWLSSKKIEISSLLSDLVRVQNEIELSFYPVSLRVNSVKNDDPDLVAPYSEPQESLF